MIQINFKFSLHKANKNVFRALEEHFNKDNIINKRHKGELIKAQYAKNNFDTNLYDCEFVYSAADGLDAMSTREHFTKWASIPMRNPNDGLLKLQIIG